MGAIQFTQFRVQSISCDVPSFMESSVTKCYPRNFKESQSAYGPENSFIYADLPGPGYSSATSSRLYPSAGFAEIISANTSQRMEQIQSLQVCELFLSSLIYLNRIKDGSIAILAWL